YQCIHANYVGSIFLLSHSGGKMTEVYSSVTNVTTRNMAMHSSSVKNAGISHSRMGAGTIPPMRYTSGTTYIVVSVTRCSLRKSIATTTDPTLNFRGMASNSSALSWRLTTGGRTSGKPERFETSLGMSSISSMTAALRMDSKSYPIRARLMYTWTGYNGRMPLM